MRCSTTARTWCMLHLVWLSLARAALEASGTAACLAVRQTATQAVDFFHKRRPTAYGDGSTSNVSCYVSATRAEERCRLLLQVCDVLALAGVVALKHATSCRRTSKSPRRVSQPTSGVCASVTIKVTALFKHALARPVTSTYAILRSQLRPSIAQHAGPVAHINVFPPAAAAARPWVGRSQG